MRLRLELGDVLLDVLARDAAVEPGALHPIEIDPVLRREPAHDRRRADVAVR